MKICCVTGHRPQNFPWDYETSSLTKIYLNDMKEIVETLIADGFDYFISGGAIGVDMDFAETIIQARKRHKHIRLEIAIPCKNQDLKWGITDKLRYRKILKKADFVNILSERYTPYCMQRRNEYMVDKSDLVLAFWRIRQPGGTYNTIKYAKAHGVRYLIHDLDAHYSN